MQENPFPGMNPWLESHWGDIHTSLTTYARDQLQPQLPDGLRARVEEYVGVEADDRHFDSSRFSPDVRVIQRHQSATANVPTAAVAVADNEPVIVPRFSDPPTLHRLQIVDAADGHRIITSIEFLSPANKVGAAGREQYQAKQTKMLLGNVNLVEIDLVRRGDWVIAAPRESVPADRRGPYRICIVRAERPQFAELYRAGMHKPLPTVKIPLRRTDDDVELPLQTLIDRAYVNGNYGDDIRYDRDPDPPLSDPDAAWANRWLSEQGVR